MHLCERGSGVIVSDRAVHVWQRMRLAEGIRMKNCRASARCPIATVPGTVGRCIPTSFDFSDVDNPFPEKVSEIDSMGPS